MQRCVQPLIRGYALPTRIIEGAGGLHLSPRTNHIHRSMLKVPIPSCQCNASTANALMEMQYQYPRLDNVENVERYTRGGFHPIHLAETFKHGRYRILHKLGYGGFSTVWLARDEHLQRFVSLKVLTAEASYKPKELNMLQYIDEHFQSDSRRNYIISVLDNFLIQGPNGDHLCYVSPVGGPSMSQLTDCPGQTIGSRRLRASLARKLAGQLASAVSFLHSLGIVHGDLTPKNVLLRLSNIDEWSLDDVDRQLDSPIKDEVLTFSGEKPGNSAPEYIVQPTSFSSVAPKYISEDVLLIDLGEAFLKLSPPSQGVGTPVSYCSPELMLERKATTWSDIWALSCTMFEMRSGFPLFESFLRSSKEVLQEMVRILGAPPKSWWPAFEKRNIHIRQDGAQYESLIGERIREIGMDDEGPSIYDIGLPLSNQPASELVMEPVGTRISEDEANCLAGLLQRTLSFTPEERMPVDRTLKHRWLTGGN